MSLIYLKYKSVNIIFERMKRVVFFSFFLMITSGLFAQKLEKSFTVFFYNVENLFDTIAQAGVEDHEFLPTAEKKWNSDKYVKKIEDLAKVISSVGSELPELVGLAEVENREVLLDLIHSSALLSGNYGIVHEDSPDERGIDVALLYRKDRFIYKNHEKLSISLPFDSTDSTRDILYVNGEAPDGKELNIFVNHWSSRYGSMKESEPKRLMAAVTLRRRIDMLLGRSSDPRIILMGDFNDEPTNRSVNSILQATNKRKNIEVGDLYNLFYDMHNMQNKGSYYYKGAWNMLDQIIVSYNLIDKKSNYSTTYEGGQIFKEEFMVYKNEKGDEVPNRTYGGPVYYGGISDHFPVYVVFTLNLNK